MIGTVTRVEPRLLLVQIQAQYGDKALPATPIVHRTGPDAPNITSYNVGDRVAVIEPKPGDFIVLGLAGTP